ncbi:3-isopropylmalate dehydrogenase [Neonectria magnoliae]|uniref:3-isopropylmalate dehydrogenase n=1 Tax=Neonectria magnoliae TaxID=2732573 RepID=A0ABR1ICQ2_9HYPO
MTTTTFRILALPGDHVGPEVMGEALKVLDAIEELRPTLKFERTCDLTGGSSIDKHGVPITEDVLEKAVHSDAVLFGSVGGPEWAHASPGPETGLLLLRKRLNAFANLRPCEILVPSLIDASPIKADIARGTKFIVVRENCGGAYFGEKVEADDVASDFWVYTPSEVQHLGRVNANVARILGRDGDNKGGGGPAIVRSADKANVLASGRLWRRVTQQLFDDEFPDVELRHQLADSMAMLMVKNPRGFNGVIHTDNTFGDILSDISGGIVDSLGTLPSASISGIPGEGDATASTNRAPDIAGKGVVNPAAQILSLAMLLRYSCLLLEEASAIEQAVARVFDSKDSGGLEVRSKDVGGDAGTTRVGDFICEVLKNILSA